MYEPEINRYTVDRKIFIISSQIEEYDIKYSNIMIDNIYIYTYQNRAKEVELNIQTYI